MNNNTIQKTIPVPQALLERLVEHSSALLDAHNELEDFYLSRNPSIIKKLREARMQHQAGNVIPFNRIKENYV